MATRPPYPIDLRNREWALIKHLVPEAKPGRCPEAYLKREILNGIFALLRRGCSWRMLSDDPPLWRAVQDGTADPSGTDDYENPLTPRFNRNLATWATGCTSTTCTNTS